MEPVRSTWSVTLKLKLQAEHCKNKLLNQLHIWLFCAADVLQHCKQSGATTNHSALMRAFFSLSVRLTERQEWLQIEDKQAAVSTR